MTSAREIVKEQYITQHELADLLNVTPERIRDLRSKHRKDGDFIDSYQPTARCVLFDVKDVLKFIVKSKNTLIDFES